MAAGKKVPNSIGTNSHRISRVLRVGHGVKADIAPNRGPAIHTPAPRPPGNPSGGK